MSEREPCPAPGCPEQGTRAELSGHWGGKSDDAHSGSFREAFDSESASDGASAGPSESPDPEGDRSGNPTFGDADPSGDPDEIDLPCGHDSYDPSEAPDPPFRAECEQCGDGWTVREGE